MDDLVAAIDVVLSRVQAQAIGEYVKVTDVDDWLLDLRKMRADQIADERLLSSAMP